MNRSSSFLRRVSLIAAVFLISTAALCFAHNTPQLAMLANKAQTGATVEDVTAGGPAAKAGIAAHDIITGVEGAPLQSLMQIVEALARHKPGDSMELTIIRAADGTSTEVTMTLGANPNDASQPYMGLTIVGYLILVPDNRMTPEQQAPPAI